MTETVALEWGVRTHQEVRGVSVHVEQSTGRVAGEGRRVIGALHGFASGTFTWAGVAPGWSDGHDVVAWDRPPFGRSGRPDPTVGADDPYAVAADVERAVAVLGPHVDDGRGAVLVGHSAGALLAVQILLAEVIPVAGLVLIAPALDGAPPDLVRRLAALPGAARVGSTALRVAMLGAGPALRAMSRHPSPIVAATAAETARCLRRPGTAEALWHLTSTWQPPDLLDELGPLGVPTLVVGGRDDRISTPESTERLARRLGADVRILEGVGHAAQEQVPEIVGPLVGAFVDGIGR